MTISVYIDCENIYPVYAEQLFEKLANVGTVVSATGYADFSTRDCADWQAPLFKHKARAVQTFHNTKDGADAEILIDVVSGTTADAVCIVSRDGIYSALARVVRATGKTFIVVGSTPTSAALMTVADIYIPLEHMDVPVREVLPPKEAINAAINALGGGRVLMADLGNELIKQRFCVQEQGFAKLIDLIYSLGGYIITTGENNPLEKWIEIKE